VGLPFIKLKRDKIVVERLRTKPLSRQRNRSISGIGKCLRLSVSSGNPLLLATTRSSAPSTPSIAKRSGRRPPGYGRVSRRRNSPTLRFAGSEINHPRPRVHARDTPRGDGARGRGSISCSKHGILLASQGAPQTDADMIAESGNENSHASRYRFDRFRPAAESSGAAAQTAGPEPGI
jgi:hypothetical protein